MSPEKNTSLDEFLADPDIKKIFAEVRRKAKEQPLISKPEDNKSGQKEGTENVPIAAPALVPSATRPQKTKALCLTLLNQSTERLTAKMATSNLANQGHDVNFEQVKKCLNRLTKEQLVQKQKIDGISWYEKKSVEAQPQLSPDTLELEQRLSDAVMKRDKLPTIHKVTLVISRETIEDAINRDKIEARLSAPTPRTLTPEHIKSVLLNSMHPDSIYQRWSRTAIKDNCRDVKGGFQEIVKITPETGFTGSMTAQVFGTGSVKITFDFSEHPVDLRKWREFEQWLTGMTQGRCGYGFLELTHVTKINFEWNIDTAMEGFDGSGKFCRTVQQFDEMFMRVYTKEMQDGQWVLRKEVGMDVAIPYDNYMRQADAMIAGGVSTQWMFHSQHQNEEFIKTMDRFVSEQHQINKSQHSTLLTVARRMDEQAAINKKLLEYLGKKEN